MYIPRLATASDLNSLVSIILSCFDDDPCYPYRFPNKHLYPQEYEDYCRRKCTEYLETSTVIVCEVGGHKVAGFGVWDEPEYRLFKGSRSQTWPRTTGVETSANINDKKAPKASNASATPAAATHHPKPQQPLSPLYSRPDRSLAFVSASKAARTKFFDKPYTAGGYMFLRILMVQPEYRLRGVGTALVRWGTERGQLEGVNTGLFSSPMGYKFYPKLGFARVGRFEVRVGDEEERLDWPVMVLRPPSMAETRARRGSCCAAEMGVVGGLRRVVTVGGMIVQEA